jgi:hypothetical protein
MAAPAAGPGGPPPNPTTDPNQLTMIIAAIMEQGAQQFQGEQQAALGQAVSQLLQQTPNQAGLDATTMPGAPPAPPMPSQNGTGGAMEDPSLSPTSAGSSFGP